MPGIGRRSMANEEHHNQVPSPPKKKLQRWQPPQRDGSAHDALLNSGTQRGDWEGRVGETLEDAAGGIGLSLEPAPRGSRAGQLLSCRGHRSRGASAPPWPAAAHRRQLGAAPDRGSRRSTACQTEGAELPTPLFNILHGPGQPLPDAQAPHLKLLTLPPGFCPEYQPAHQVHLTHRHKKAKRY